MAFRHWRKEHRKGHPKWSLEFLKLWKEPLIISKLYISTAQDGLFKSTFSNVNHTNKLQFVSTIYVPTDTKKNLVNHLRSYFLDISLYKIYNLNVKI